MTWLSAQLFNRLNRGLVVSCQAPVDSPLHDAQVISAMALTAELRGALGLRIDSPEHIQAVRQACTLPIIGLWKRDYVGSSVYITPTFADAQAVSKAGADLIAIDCTSRDRPQGEQLIQLIDRIHGELHKPVLADIDDLESARYAASLGVDAIATTLWSYTEKTAGQVAPNLELLKNLISEVSLPVILEGGVHSPEIAQQAIAQGAWAVVVGHDITGIDRKIEQYCQHLTSLTAHDSQS